MKLTLVPINEECIQFHQQPQDAVDIGRLARDGRAQDLDTAMMKKISLPEVGGSLTLSGTFNALYLVGEERDLVFQIADLMRAYEEKTKGTSVCPHQRQDLLDP